MSRGDHDGGDRGSSPPPTRIERGAGAPATRLEGGPRTRLEGSRAATTRVNLPPALAERFEALDDISGRGAEADLLLVEEHETGERRVVKLYRQSIRRVDAEMLVRVRQADRAHVVEVIDSGEEEGFAWEVLEYCELGSLEDLLDQNAGRLQDPAARASPAEAVLEEVATALEHIHGLGFAHRDVKPANILVRTLEPLDLILADFGLATVMEASQVFGTASRTPGYAAPEAAAGGLHRTSDWWSLGVILVEILAGRHPLALSDGTMPQPAQLDAEVLTRGVDVSAVQDDRWRNLCRGLLTRDPEHRWGAEQVNAWRRGESPPISQEPAGAPTLGRRRISPFPFRDPETGREREFTNPVELANALASDWDAAAELVEGRDRRQLRTLRDFLESCEFEHADRLLASDDPPETILVRLLVGLDPRIEPTFRGLSLSREGLRGLASEAVTNESRADALTAIYEGRVLRHYVADEGERADFASLDTAWHRNARSLEAYLERFASQLPGAAAARVLPVARARIMLAQLELEHREELARDAEEARNDAEARRQPWFREFADAESPEGDLAHLVVLVLLREEAVRSTRAEVETERQAALRRQGDRATAQRRLALRLARFAAEGGAAGLVVWLPWAGAAALFNWQGISVKAFLVCVLGGAIYRVGSTQPAWIEDWRHWRGSIRAPAGPTPPGPRPALPISRFVSISLMLLAVTGVVKGCGALADNAQRDAELRHPGRHNDPPPIGRDLDPALSSQLADTFGRYALARSRRAPANFEVQPDTSGSVRRRAQARATLVVDSAAHFSKPGDDAMSAEAQLRLHVRFARRGGGWRVAAASPSFREILSKLRQCDIESDTDGCDFR